MSMIKCTILIEGEEDSDEVSVTFSFDPPISAEGKVSAVEILASDMLAAVKRHGDEPKITKLVSVN